MSRIKDIQAEAITPASDDFGVIDGNTFGPRRIHFGSAATREVPASGDAAPNQVVLGSDSRIASTLSHVVITSPQDGDLIQFDSSTASWRNSQKSLLTDGGNY